MKIQSKKGRLQLRATAASIWQAPFLANEILSKYPTEPSHYSIDIYDHLKGEMLGLYHTFKKRVRNIDAPVKEEYKKLYIVFKSSTNFVNVAAQKSKLRLTLNMDFDSVIDPKGVCKGVTNLGRRGNGDVEVGLSNINRLDDLMELVQQAFDKQMETV